MKLILCLGNPEKRYDGTRHNIGFAIADSIAEQYGTAWKPSARFRADTATATVNEQKVLLCKPMTYYNLTGESYRALTDYYQIDPSDTLVIHDDLALDLGVIRTRTGGSGGGNNGIRSINQHGGSDTRRMRIGVSGDRSPHVSDSDYVLGRLTKPELEALDELMPTIHEIVTDFCKDSFDTTTYTTKPADQSAG